MIKLSRMTDYGIVVMSQLRTAPEDSRTSTELSGATGIPLPTVSKLLKALARAGLVTSRRGAHGGYALVRDLDAITATEIIEALEGPVALTACVDGSDSACGVEALCPIRGGWDRINEAIRSALETVTLAELCAPSLTAPASTAPTSAAAGSAASSTAASSTGEQRS